MTLINSIDRQWIVIDLFKLFRNTNFSDRLFSLFLSGSDPNVAPISKIVSFPEPEKCNIGVYFFIKSVDESELDSDGYLTFFQDYNNTELSVKKSKAVVSVDSGYVCVFSALDYDRMHSESYFAGSGVIDYCDIEDAGGDIFTIEEDYIKFA